MTTHKQQTLLFNVMNYYRHDRNYSIVLCLSDTGVVFVSDKLQLTCLQTALTAKELEQCLQEKKTASIMAKANKLYYVVPWSMREAAFGLLTQHKPKATGLITVDDNGLVVVLRKAGKLHNGILSVATRNKLYKEMSAELVKVYGIAYGS